MKQILTLLATLLLGVQGAFAAVVLHVDISDPSAVVITATGNPASFTGTAGAFENGVQLWEFFSSTNSAFVFGSGDLTVGAYSTTARFDDVYKDTDRALVLYDYNGTQPLAFSSSFPAFSGSAVFDLSSYAAQLPTVGTTGNVLTWDEEGIIGQYVVVPEPSLALLGVAGLAALGLTRLRNRRNS